MLFAFCLNMHQKQHGSFYANRLLKWCNGTTLKKEQISVNVCFTLLWYPCSFIVASSSIALKFDPFIWTHSLPRHPVPSLKNLQHRSLNLPGHRVCVFFFFPLHFPVYFNRSGRANEARLLLCSLCFCFAPRCFIPLGASTAFYFHFGGCLLFWWITFPFPQRRSQRWRRRGAN